MYDKMHKITDKIFLGDSAAAGDLDYLQEIGIDGVLNVAFDLDMRENYYYRGIRAHKVGLIDGPGNKIGDYYAAVLKLDSLLKTQNQVLVHCHAGVSRSPFIVSLYLLATKQVEGDLWHAINFVASKRPCVDPAGGLQRDFKLIDMELLRKLMTY